jgi:hypothetical protein
MENPILHHETLKLQVAPLDIIYRNKRQRSHIPTMNHQPAAAEEQIFHFKQAIHTGIAKLAEICRV